MRHPRCRWDVHHHRQHSEESAAPAAPAAASTTPIVPKRPTRRWRRLPRRFLDSQPHCRRRASRALANGVLPTMDGRSLAAPLAAMALFVGIPSGIQAEQRQPSLLAPPSAVPAAMRELGQDTQYEGVWGDPTDPKQAPSVAAATDCCRLCPCTYAVLEALVLERNVSGTPFPLAVDATTGQTLASTNDLDFPFSGGLRAYVGHRFCGPWALELGYFGLFDATASTTITGDISLPGDLGPGTNVFFGADRITLDYTSRLHGGELNFVCC